MKILKITSFISGLSPNVRWILAVVLFILFLSSWILFRICRSGNNPKEGSKLDVLRKRYISGEISKEVFLENLKEI